MKTTKKPKKNDRLERRLQQDLQGAKKLERKLKKAKDWDQKHIDDLIKKYGI